MKIPAASRTTMHRMPQREPATSILFLEGAPPAFEANEITITRQLKIGKVTQELLAQLGEQGARDARAMLEAATSFIQYEGTNSTEDLILPHALYKALILTCTKGLKALAHVIVEPERHGRPAIVTATPLPRDERALGWGHYQNDGVIEADINSAAALYRQVAEVHLTENYHRVGNALMFYMNGYESGNPDLALISFTTTLEGLFSTMEQEISFRLSLRAAQFLSATQETRRETYKNCREVYNVRSKIVHGARLRKGSAEAAAIYLVEGMLPLAEQLARNCLNKIFALGLQTAFDNPARIEAIFDGLLFGESLEEVLREQGHMRQ